MENLHYSYTHTHINTHKKGKAHVYMRENPAFISTFVGLGCSSVVGCKSSMCKVLGSIPTQ